MACEFPGIVNWVSDTSLYEFRRGNNLDKCMGVVNTLPLCRVQVNVGLMGKRQLFCSRMDEYVRS